MRAQMIRARAGEARNVRDLQSLVVLVPSDVVPFGSGTIAACVGLLFGVHDAVVSTLLLFVGWLVPLGVCGPEMGRGPRTGS
jgi:hypothetical protein